MKSNKEVDVFSKVQIGINGESVESLALKKMIQEELITFKATYGSILEKGLEASGERATDARIIQKTAACGFLEAVEEHIKAGNVVDITVIGRSTEIEQSDIQLSSSFWRGNNASRKHCMIVTYSNKERILVDLGSLVGTCVKFDQCQEEPSGGFVHNLLMTTNVRATERLETFSSTHKRQSQDPIHQQFTLYMKCSEQPTQGELLRTTETSGLPWKQLPAKGTKIRLDIGPLEGDVLIKEPETTKTTVTFDLKDKTPSDKGQNRLSDYSGRFVAQPSRATQEEKALLLSRGEGEKPGCCFTQ